MKVVTLEQLEQNFDEILEDVVTNKVHYRIEHSGGAAMLIPFESYDVLHDVYKDWVEEPGTAQQKQLDPSWDEFDPLWV